MAIKTHAGEHKGLGIRVISLYLQNCLNDATYLGGVAALEQVTFSMNHNTSRVTAKENKIDKHGNLLQIPSTQTKPRMSG